MKEFKEFAMRGNVIDLAVGVVIGGAFNKIVTSIVEVVLTPIIGLFTQDVDKLDDVKLGPVKIGLLIHTVLDFIIIAFALFLLVKAINKIKKKDEVPAAEPAPTKSELLLEEIRDALKK
jgi:large conductance mechanosensitive channel